MMRLWANSYSRSTPVAPSATLSFVAHVAIIAGWIVAISKRHHDNHSLPRTGEKHTIRVGRLFGDLDHEGCSYFLVPVLDRQPGLISSVREQIHFGLKAIEDVFSLRDTVTVAEVLG